MPDIKTVDDSGRIRDPLIQKQKEDVAKMRTSLLSCSDNPSSTIQAIKNITVLRIYHQLARIIRYTEMMDQIEDRIYEAIDYQLGVMDMTEPTSMLMLLRIQERLQASMIESQKLLKPYLDVPDLNLEFFLPDPKPESIAANVLDKPARDRIRNSAQELLSIIDFSEEDHNYD